MENRLKEILAEKGMTVVELSEKTGISTVSLYNVQNNKKEASANTMNKIAEVVGVPFWQLYVSASEVKTQLSPGTEREVRPLRYVPSASIGERINSVMREKGVSYAELAERMEVSRQAVNNFILAQSVTTSTVERIASALDVPVWYLFATENVSEFFASTPEPSGFSCPHCGKPIAIHIGKEESNG